MSHLHPAFISMKKLSLVAIDMDGTLLNEHKEIGELTKTVLRKLYKLGIHITLASGRMAALLTPYEQILGIDCLFVGWNGAMVLGKQSEGRPKLYERPVTASVANKIIDIAQQRKLHLNIYYDNKIYCVDTPYTRQFHELYKRRTDAQFNFISSYDEFRGKEPTKLLFIIPPEERNKLYDELANTDIVNEIHLVKSDPEYLEFLHPEVNKGTSLELLCQKLGITLDEVAAFGDAENDLEMLELAGLGLCMKNGSQKAKQIANKVTEFTNNEEGVGRELLLLAKHLNLSIDLDIPDNYNK